MSRYNCNATVLCCAVQCVGAVQPRGLLATGVRGRACAPSGLMATSGHPQQHRREVTCHRNRLPLATVLGDNTYDTVAAPATLVAARSSCWGINRIHRAAAAVAASIFFIYAFRCL